MEQNVNYFTDCVDWTRSKDIINRSGGDTRRRRNG